MQEAPVVAPVGFFRSHAESTSSLDFFPRDHGTVIYMCRLILHQQEYVIENFSTTYMLILIKLIWLSVLTSTFTDISSVHGRHEGMLIDLEYRY